jgi:hypothetical protein
VRPKSIALLNLTFTAGLLTVLVVSLSQAENSSEIETKYLMFKISKVRFDNILQLKKPGGKLDFGNSVELGYDDIESMPDKIKNIGYKITLKNPIKFSDITIHPKCILEFVESADIKKGRFLLFAVDCRSSAIEIDRIKLSGQFHSTFAKDEFHFACVPIVTVTEVPLAGGKRLPPNRTIWVEDFDADLGTNPISGISDHYPQSGK